MTPDQANGLYREIGGLVREAREAAGITQEDLARRVGLTRTSITNLEGGRQKIQVHTLFALAEAMNLAPNILLPLRLASTAPDIEPHLLTKLTTDTEERDWVLRVVRR